MITYECICQGRRKAFSYWGRGGGGAQSETTHRVVSNLYNNLWNLGGGTFPRCPPGSYAYVCEFGKGEKMLGPEIFTPYTCNKNVRAKYQCTLYTIQMLSEIYVREALPHLLAVRVSAGAFVVFIQRGPSHSMSLGVEVLQVFWWSLWSAHISQNFSGSWAYESRGNHLSTILTIVYCIV